MKTKVCSECKEAKSAGDFIDFDHSVICKECTEKELEALKRNLSNSPRYRGGLWSSQEYAVYRDFKKFFIVEDFKLLINALILEGIGNNDITLTEVHTTLNNCLNTDYKRLILERKLIHQMRIDAVIENSFNSDSPKCNICSKEITYGDYKYYSKEMCKSCKEAFLKSLQYTCYWCGNQDSYDPLWFDMTLSYRNDPRERNYHICRSCKSGSFDASDKEHQRVRNNLVRARSIDEPATLTYYEWMDTLDSFNHSCAYCNGKYEVLEHFVPIGQGAGTTKQNCIPSCQNCNLSKNSRHPILDGLPFDEAVVDKIMQFLDAA